MNFSIDNTGGNGQLQSSSDVASLSKIWAKKYVKTLHQPTPPKEMSPDVDLRAIVSQKLRKQLRNVSAQAWTKTEYLLAKEIFRHQLVTDDLDPWAISGYVHDVYLKAFESYEMAMTPERFAVNTAADLGRIREKFTVTDPRVIGFVSMQFHYTGQLLLEQAASLVQAEPYAEIESDTLLANLRQYFKAIDDHLYMPLQRAYDAAASYPYGALELKIVQHLLPQSSAIARRVVKQTMIAFPKHECHSGPLESQIVQQSSIRDTEMFQTYLWVSLLEKNLSSVQQELFPLCLMLYPMFNVPWDMVRSMLMLIELEFSRLLQPHELTKCSSYLTSLKMMFDPDVVDALR